MALNDLVPYFIYAFASLFVIVNPIEATMVFIPLTSGMDPQGKRRIYGRTTTVAFAIALLFAVAGDLVLRFFGITVDSLRVAGGVLLFLGGHRHAAGRRFSQEGHGGGDERRQLPGGHLRVSSAMPLLTGPGAITTVVVLMGAAEGPAQKAAVLAALILTFLATYLILKFSEYIDRVLGITGIMVMTRILGLILGAIAVNFVATGAWNLYRAMAGG